MDDLSFKETFRSLRKQMGMTQMQIAQHYGISRRNIENWESGQNEPPSWVAKLLIADMERYISGEKVGRMVDILEHYKTASFGNAHFGGVVTIADVIDALKKLQGTV